MKRNYEQLYKELGICVKPLGENYSPDNYGRELMRGTIINDGVMYSSSTCYVKHNDEEKTDMLRTAHI